MVRLVFSSLLALMIFVHSNQALAQAGGNVSAQGAKKRINYIVVAGLGGAILGLSTLSFYGRPQDKLSNIAIGFAFGVISGTIMTTYQAAADPKDFYGFKKDPAKAEIWALDMSNQRIQHEFPSEFAPSFKISF